MDLKKIYDGVFAFPEGKKKSKFSSIFFGFRENDFKKKIDLFYKEYEKVNGSYEYDVKVYAAVTKDVVCSYSSNKDVLLNVFKEFNGYLEEMCGIEIDIEYPPVPISNTFERLMFIAKYLQDETHLVSDLPDILWSSARTIEDDLKKLRGNDDDPLQVCGKKFVINEIDRSMGHIYFESTAHPFFLTCNLTQVITTLEGLRIMSEKPGFEGYAMSMARDIWLQLSDYGKSRIFYVKEELLGEDIAWYKSLDQEEEYSYKTEKECCKENGDILMYCLKDMDDKERLCNVEYKGDDGSELLTNIKVIQFGEEGWIVDINGKQRILDPYRIIRSSFHKENMY